MENTCINRFEEIIKSAKEEGFEGSMILYPLQDFSLEVKELLKSTYKNKYRLKTEDWTCKATSNKFKVISVSWTKWKPMIFQRMSIVSYKK